MTRETNLYLEVEKTLKDRTRKEEGLPALGLGEAVRRLREKASLSGAELCRRSKRLDPRTLTAIEKGRIRNPSLQSLQGIAQGLGCLVRDLFTPAEMVLDRNFLAGSSKGVFQMEFPRFGLKVISATPIIPEFFCGKLILAPQRRVEENFLRHRAPLFFEVVMGRVEFTVEEKTVHLKEGENLFFNGGLRHRFRNALNRESTLWLVTAPSFFRS